MTFAQEQKARLPQGTPVLNLHIPKGADLSPAAVEQALDQAMEFFPQVFPEHRARAFLYYSWLLYPGLRELLPAGEQHFAVCRPLPGHRADPGPGGVHPANLWKTLSQKRDYPQNTQLRRQALGRFSCLGEACGILEIPTPWMSQME